VTIYPSAYVKACSTIALTSTAIADFSLDVLNAAGSSASDKTFTVSNAAVTDCTDGLTFVLEFNDPARGFISNPYSTYFSIDSTTGALTYKSPPASFMNGLP
jgi:hypothetical protein